MLGLLEFACADAQANILQKEKDVILLVTESAINKGKWQVWGTFFLPEEAGLPMSFLLQ